MTFLGAPLSTILPVAGAAAAALVALYLLRPARRRVEVPYARLWGLLVKEARATRVARRLRRWESLLLQLLIAALLLFALTDPHPGQQGARPRQVILVDTSASMQATDAGAAGTRMERARLAVARILDGLKPDEEAMLVGYDAAPQPLSPMTTEEPVLRAAAQRLIASDAPDALLPALGFAADALAGAPAPRLTIVSDGNADGQAIAALQSGLDHRLDAIEVRYEAIGGTPVAPGVAAPADNLAITAFSVRRYPANPSAYEILVELSSFSDHERKARLVIEQEGEVVERTEVTLAPGERRERHLTDLSGEGRRLEARLESLEKGGGDALPLDDQAYALLPDRRRTRVLLVGEGDLYTEGALLLDRQVEVVREKPAAYDAAKAAAFDAILFDGFVPPALPPRPTFYLGCEGAACPFATHGSVESPLVTEVEREHPLLRWVALKDMNVSRSLVFAPAHGDVALASAIGKPIFITGERQGLRMVALGFRPSASDLPLRVAFPVLLVNAVEWLSGRKLDPSESVRTGERARLPARGSEVEVTGPDGLHRELPARDGRVELIAERVGYYTLGEQGTQRLIAANLNDARESSLVTRQLILAGHALPAPTPPARLRPRAALWRWLAILALCLVLFEWWSFHRRWTV
jgi:hypothetical protein